MNGHSGPQTKGAKSLSLKFKHRNIWDQVMLVQLAAQIFILVARKLFSIDYFV